jgi:hypothetical protein
VRGGRRTSILTPVDLERSVFFYNYILNDVEFEDFLEASSDQFDLFCCGTCCHCWCFFLGFVAGEESNE